MKITILSFLLFCMIICSCKIKQSSELADISAILTCNIDSCPDNCIKTIVYLKNNTPNKIYIEKNKICANNIFNLPVLKEPIFKRNRRFLYPIKFIKNEKSLKDFYYEKQPENFLKEVEEQELLLFCKHNNLDPNDSLVKREITNWVRFMYNHNFVFLEPYETCMIDQSYIKFLKKKKLKINWQLESGKNDEYIKSSLADGRKIELKRSYLSEVAGYKLFYGKIKSNTFVIKKGKIIKEKPARKVKKRKIK